jgi:hypothetical protein
MAQIGGSFGIDSLGVENESLETVSFNIGGLDTGISVANERPPKSLTDIFASWVGLHAVDVFIAFIEPQGKTMEEKHKCHINRGVKHDLEA